MHSNSSSLVEILMKRPGRCGISNLLNSEESLQLSYVEVVSASDLDLFRGACNVTVLNGGPQVADHDEF
jgi:hypothetical protein